MYSESSPSNNRYFDAVVYSVRNDTISASDINKEEKDRSLLWADLYFKSIFTRPHLVPSPYKAICAVVKEESEKLGFGNSLSLFSLFSSLSLSLALSLSLTHTHTHTLFV